VTSRRILQLTPSLGGGGAERQLAYLAGALVKSGWDVHVAYTAEGPNLARLAESGAQLHPLPARSNLDPLLVPRVIGLLRRIRPQLLQTWNPMMDVIGGLAAVATSVPWILSERSSPASYPVTWKLRARRHLARRAAAVASNSRVADRYWSERLPGSTLRRVIGNAIPVDAIAAAPRAERARFGVPEDRPLLVFVGRLSYEKNLDVLLDALELAQREGALFALLCGDGPLREHVEARLSAGSLRGSAAAPGFVSDVWSWMKCADSMAFPSLFEGMPNTVMEAMAAGCPLVLSDIPSHREHVGRDEALFVPTDDREALARAIRACLDDRAAARERAERARAHSADWSLDAVVREWEEFYEEVARRA
jgi:glycosyltransferase involved in cell wall biosynthesis